MTGESRFTLTAEPASFTLTWFPDRCDECQRETEDEDLVGDAEHEGVEQIPDFMVLLAVAAANLFWGRR